MLDEDDGLHGVCNLKLFMFVETCTKADVDEGCKRATNAHPNTFMSDNCYEVIFVVFKVTVLLLMCNTDCQRTIVIICGCHWSLSAEN